MTGRDRDTPQSGGETPGAEEPAEEGFLGRWARRKAAARKAAPDGATTAAGAADADVVGAAAESENASTPDAAPDAAPELPDPDSLERGDDFSRYLGERVPEALRRRALRRLWRLDPVFANLDGLLDHGEDYTDAAVVRPGMKTAYTVGRGFRPLEPAAGPEAAPRGEGPVSSVRTDAAGATARDGEAAGETSGAPGAEDAEDIASAEAARPDLSAVGRDRARGRQVRQDAAGPASGATPGACGREEARALEAAAPKGASSVKSVEKVGSLPKMRFAFPGDGAAPTSDDPDLA